MKRMKRCISILSFVFSLVALVLSAYAVSNQHEACIPTFVLSLVGICATLIVGISVVDSIVLRSALHKVDEKMEKQAKKMEELSKVEEDLKKTKQRANMLFHLSWGLIIIDNQPCTAFLHFWRGFILAAQENDIKRAKACIIQAEKLIEDISRKMQERPLSLDNPKRIQEINITDDLKESLVYTAFGERAEKMLEKIKKTISEKQPS